MCTWGCGWSVCTWPPGDEKSKRKRRKEAGNLGTDGKSHRNRCLPAWLFRWLSARTLSTPVHLRMRLTHKCIYTGFVSEIACSVLKRRSACEMEGDTRMQSVTPSGRLSVMTAHSSLTAETMHVWVLVSPEEATTWSRRGHSILCMKCGQSCAQCHLQSAIRSPQLTY